MPQQTNGHPGLADQQAGAPQHGEMRGGQFYPDEEAQLQEQIQQAVAQGEDPMAAEQRLMTRQQDPDGARKALDSFGRLLASHYGRRPPMAMSLTMNRMSDPEGGGPPAAPAPATPSQEAFDLAPLAGGS